MAIDCSGCNYYDRIYGCTNIGNKCEYTPMMKKQEPTICRNKDCRHHLIAKLDREGEMIEFCPNESCFYHTHEQTEVENKWKFHDH